LLSRDRIDHGLEDHPHVLDLGPVVERHPEPTHHRQATSASGIVGFLLFPPNWWETAADMPIQLALLQGSSSAFRPGLIAL
jgi:hypothetical protein